MQIAACVRVGLLGPRDASHTHAHAHTEVACGTRHFGVCVCVGAAGRGVWNTPPGLSINPTWPRRCWSETGDRWDNRSEREALD